jgi:hypothetical protein
MKQSSTPEANIRMDNQGIPNLLWNPDSLPYTYDSDTDPHSDRD